MAKLTDADVRELRTRAFEGVPSGELALAFGVSKRHVDRLLRGDQRQMVDGPAVRPVLEAVERLLDGLDLDSTDRVLAETARTVAGSTRSERG